MAKLTIREKLATVRRKASARKLKIRKDRRLLQTPYRAMNEFAGKELKQPHIKGYITYSPQIKTKKMLVMDLNHEIIEYDKMKKGWKYKRAHKLANRKQRSF